MRRLLRRVLPASVYRRHVGRHEDTSLDVWRQLARGVAGHQAILDIGAYRGEYALAARFENPAVDVVAFEPNRESVAIIRASCNLAGIRLEAMAVGAHDGWACFRDDGARSQIVEGVGTSVPVVTLDTWTAAQDVHPGLIKIDVEGGEAAILHGAPLMLRALRPTILCEVLTNEAGRAVMAALPLGYVYFHIDENGGRLTERAVITRDRWRDKNWLLAWPSSVVPRVW